MYIKKWNIYKVVGIVIIDFSLVLNTAMHIPKHFSIHKPPVSDELHLIRSEKKV